jgi:hypothetical protein
MWKQKLRSIEVIERRRKMTAEARRIREKNAGVGGRSSFAAVYLNLKRCSLNSLTHISTATAS